MDLFLDRWALLKVRDYGIECEVRHASPGSARTPGRLGPAGSMLTSRTVHSNRPPPTSETTERLGYRGGRGSAPRANAQVVAAPVFKRSVTAGKATERTSMQGTQGSPHLWAGYQNSPSSSVSSCDGGDAQRVPRRAVIGRGAWSPGQREGESIHALSSVAAPRGGSLCCHHHPVGWNLATRAPRAARRIGSCGPSRRPRTQ